MNRRESLKPAERITDLLPSNLKCNKLLIRLNVALMAVWNVISTWEWNRDVLFALHKDRKLLCPYQTCNLRGSRSELLLPLCSLLCTNSDATFAKWLRIHSWISFTGCVLSENSRTLMLIQASKITFWKKLRCPPPSRINELYFNNYSSQKFISAHRVQRHIPIKLN